MRAFFAPLICGVIVICLYSPVFANHGPGTSGGGSSTISGETLKSGQFELDLRLDFTDFENVSRRSAERRALTAGEFDAIDHSYITSFSLSYGIVEDLQASATIGYYWGEGFIDAESEDGVDAESSTANPQGLTDLYLNLKWRFVKGQPGNIALIGGIKLPTGRDDVHLSNGESLEPSSQPGSGAVDYQLGLAYSRFLTSRITIDASALYTFRGEHDDFRVGDRFDAGLAIAYRLTDSIRAFPNFSVFGEALYVHLEKDSDDGEHNPNSGGDTIYASLGGRVRFNERLGLTVAPAVPVYQHLNGDQIETSWKLAATLSYSL
jgi:hypothetical protein